MSGTVANVIYGWFLCALLGICMGTGKVLEYEPRAFIRVMESQATLHSMPLLSPDNPGAMFGPPLPMRFYMIFLSCVLASVQKAP